MVGCTFILRQISCHVTIHASSFQGGAPEAAAGEAFYSFISIDGSPLFNANSLALVCGYFKARTTQDPSLEVQNVHSQLYVFANATYAFGRHSVFIVVSVPSV